MTVYAENKELILTELQIQLPEGCCGNIALCSNVELWEHIIVFPGVIDEDYRGNVGIILFNYS
jgi:dUTP pyrophosphatase